MAGFVRWKMISCSIYLIRSILLFTNLISSSPFSILFDKSDRSISCLTILFFFPNSLRTSIFWFFISSSCFCRLSSLSLSSVRISSSFLSFFFSSSLWISSSTGLNWLSISSTFLPVDFSLASFTFRTSG